MNENSVFRFSDADEMLDLAAFEGEYEAIAEIRSGFLCTVAE